MFGAVHAAYTVGRKVNGPIRTIARKTFPTLVCTNVNVIFATRLLIESTRLCIDIIASLVVDGTAF